MITAEMLARYINNLTDLGKHQVLMQLLLYPESKPFIMNSVAEFEKFFMFPIDKKQ